MITYRPFTELDDQQMRWISETDCRVPLDWDSHHELSEEMLQERIQTFRAADIFTQAAFDGGKIVGFHVITKANKFSTPYASIITLWVDSDYRGRGIARGLKEMGEAWARSLGLSYMKTTVHSKNLRMLDLNLKNGFTMGYHVLIKNLN